ncbi:CDP-diacylglycerol--serine O-phosphatidyltransferase [soil metagenome]
MAGRRSPRERLPALHLMPNLVTIVGLCAGLTSIRFVLAERYELAALLIIFAAVLDGVDGLLARKLNAASPFGAELDTLSDFLNFGVAPGLLVYAYALSDAGGFGWAFVLVYAISCCLRLARFNVSRAAPPPAGRVHFIGVPAPAGALMALLPVFLSFEDIVPAPAAPTLTALYLGLIGLLMVSRIRTFSPRSLRISRRQGGWALIATALIVGLALTRFWLLMVLACAAYGALVAHGVLPARLKQAWRARRGQDED